jgi:hypothetical protein
MRQAREGAPKAHPKTAESAPANEAATTREPGPSAFSLAIAPPLERTSASAEESPLRESVRGELEGRFGRDLSHVRVHTGPRADALARSYGSRALARRSDIYFAAAEFDPATSRGRQLLAHEVSHVIQQGTAGPTASSEELEAEANRAATAVTNGDRARVTRSAAPGIAQHQPRGTPGAPPVPDVSTSTLITMALDRLGDLQTAAPGLGIVIEELHRLQSAPVDAQTPAVRTRVQHLLETLLVAAPAITNLSPLRDPAHYLERIAPTIVGESTRITRLYATVIARAFSDAGADQAALDQADAAMAAFPRFITDQYLGSQGIPHLIREIPVHWQRVLDLRTRTGHGARGIDALLGGWGGNPAWMRDLITRELWRDLETAQRSVRRNEPGAFESITRLTERTQVVLAIVAGASFYEQFSAWEQELGSHWVLDHFPPRRPEAATWRDRFDRILGQFEAYRPELAADQRQAIVRGAMTSLQQAVADPEFTGAWDRIQDRLSTIALVNRLATIALITAAAALTGGLAAEAAAPMLAAMGASAEVATAGAFVADVLAFTFASRAGQTIAFGAPDTSIQSDLFWNTITLVGVRGVARAFSAAAQAARAGRLLRIGFGFGRAATTVVVLHGVAEVQAASAGHRMSDEERYRAIVQNVLLMGALELGRFITEPIQERVGGAVRARFRRVFGDRLSALDAERAALHAQLDRLHRATATAQEVEAVLDRIERIASTEMNLLENAARRRIMSEDQIETVLEGYRAAVRRLELRLAQLGIAAPTTGRAPDLRALSPGVVIFSPAAEETIRGFYREPGSSLLELAEGVLRGQAPSGEVVYYVPEGRTSQRLPSYQQAAAAHDLAHLVAQTDQQAASGLRRLSSSNQGFNVLAVSEILADVAPGAMSDFLHAMRDPRFDRRLGVDFMKVLARNPDLLEFAVEYDPRTAAKIVREGGAGWRSIFERTTALLDEQPTPEARAATAERIRTARGGLRGIETVLGTPRARARPRPRASVDARKSDPQWAHYVEEATDFATRHGEHLTPEQIDMRAQMLQISADAERRVFRTRSHANRLAILDAYDRLGRLSGQLDIWTNRGRGDLSEWLFNPSRMLRKRFFLHGVEQTRNVSDCSILDYSIETDQQRPDGQPLVEWVEQKSDILDGSAGTRAAGRYLGEGIADLANLPRGDRLSIDFVRDPGDATRQAMMRILFGPRSPFTRVKFGTSWYTRADLRPL